MRKIQIQVFGRWQSVKRYTYIVAIEIQLGIKQSLCSVDKWWWYLLIMYSSIFISSDQSLGIGAFLSRPLVNLMTHSYAGVYRRLTASSVFFQGLTTIQVQPMISQK